MTDGLLLRAGPGRRIQGAAMTPTVGAGQPQAWPAFEAEAAPGYVGAHPHNEAGELCHILDGEPDRLAFEPLARTAGTWRGGEPAGGARVLRGGPGAATVVPARSPHAFANPATTPARMPFLASPPRHQDYLDQTGELIGRAGPPDPAAIAEARARHDIQQLTPMIVGRP